MVLPSAVLLTVLNIFPLFFTIKNSFTDYYLLSKTRSSFIGVRNYVNIFKDAYFQKSLWNTVKFTVLTVIPIKISNPEFITAGQIRQGCEAGRAANHAVRGPRRRGIDGRPSGGAALR